MTPNGATNDGAAKKPTTTTIRAIEDIPTFSMVPLTGPEGTIEGFNGVFNTSTGRTVAVQSDRYELLQHRDVAQKVLDAARAFGVEDANILRAGDGTHYYEGHGMRLYDGGRAFEYKLVLPTKAKLTNGEEFYPAFRVRNSVNGTIALRVSGYALRLACTNQLWAPGNVLEVHEVHLHAADDLLALIQKGMYEYLGKFDGVLDTYQKAMAETIEYTEVAPRLTGFGLPAKYAKVISEGVGRIVFHGSETAVPRWDAYQVATEFLTHGGIRVNPAREEMFERAAAKALLLDTELPQTEEEVAVVAPVA